MNLFIYRFIIWWTYMWMGIKKNKNKVLLNAHLSSKSITIAIWSSIFLFVVFFSFAHES
jgi:hypothetical protein